MVGLLLLLWIAGSRLHHLRPIGVAIGVTGVVAGAFVVSFSQDLIVFIG